MESHSSIKTYLSVFAALAVLTLLTVTASYLHLSHPKAIALAVGIIAVKVSLIAAFFMHLKYEKATILRLVFSALILVAVLLFFVLPDFF